jgi:hypothetical protein
MVGGLLDPRLAQDMHLPLPNSDLKHSLSATITGMRLCSSPMTLFVPQVRMVQLRTSSPLGEFHLAQSPAITIGASSAIAMA